MGKKNKIRRKKEEKIKRNWNVRKLKKKGFGKIGNKKEF